MKETKETIGKKLVRILILIFLNTLLYIAVLFIFNDQKPKAHYHSIGAGIGDFFDSMVYAYFITSAIMVVVAIILRRKFIVIGNVALICLPLLVVFLSNAYNSLRYVVSNLPARPGKVLVADDSCSAFRKGCYTQFIRNEENGRVLVQDFYPSGKKRSDPYIVTSEHVAGMPYYHRIHNVIGPLVLWYESGEKEREVNYIEANKKDGRITEWYQSGQKYYEANYQNDLSHGRWTLWHPNGQKNKDGHLINGKRVGVFYTWDEEGNIVEEKDYGYPEESSLDSSKEE